MKLGLAVGGRPGITVVSAAMNDAGVPMAVKALHPDVDPASVIALRFRREIDAHVVASGVHGVIPARRDPEHPEWLVMQWAYGGDMAEAVDRSPLVRDRLAHDASDIAVSLLRTVAGLHAIGIAHRDIKPSNVLVDGERVWLTDFGICARRLDARAPADAEWEALPPPHREITAGTPRWSAPELQRTPPAVTPASDVYAVALLWEWMRSLGQAKILTTVERDVLYDMLHHDPRHRPTAAAALLELHSDRGA